MPEFPYLHGFSDTETERLRRQARFAEHTVYQDIDLTKVTNLLEAGCGVGAQTEILLRRFPEIRVTGVDRSEQHLSRAQAYLGSFPYANDRYEFLQMNVAQLDLPSESYDGAFLCWVLEHVEDPTRVLAEVRRVLRPGGVIYVTEVLNSSFLIDPYSPHMWRYWLAFNDFQIDSGGSPFIGAKLGNLLMQTGYRDVSTTSKTWHFDNRQPARRKETIEFWTELLLSASDQLLEEKRVDQETVDEMKNDLEKIARDPNAVFYYTFVQARAARG